MVDGHEVTVPHLAEVALRQGVWGKWCKILHSCNFLALKMIPRKPNFLMSNKSTFEHKF